MFICTGGNLVASAPGRFSPRKLVLIALANQADETCGSKSLRCQEQSDLPFPAGKHQGRLPVACLRVQQLLKGMLCLSWRLLCCVMSLGSCIDRLDEIKPAIVFVSTGKSAMRTEILLMKQAA